jgi:hypothetical protein
MIKATDHYIFIPLFSTFGTKDSLKNMKDAPVGLGFSAAGNSLPAPTYAPEAASAVPAPGYFLSVVRCPCQGCCCVVHALEIDLLQRNRFAGFSIASTSGCLM